MTVANDDVLASMFSENTGASFLDSGGAYGRNWERNQGKDLDKEPTATLEVSKDDSSTQFDLTIDSYHFCKERLDFNPEFNARFEEFAKQPEFENEGWLAIIEAWIKSLTEEYRVTSFYGESYPDCCNTYNHENNLSQTLQFYVMELYEKTESYRVIGRAIETLCILQVHGGCDVRGGYTAPKVFTTTGSDGTEMLDYARGNIGCENGHYWYTDDAYNWYAGESTVDYIEKDTLFGDVTHKIEVKELTEYSAEDFDYIQVGEYSWEGVAHCPVCKALKKEKVPLKGFM